MTARLARSIRAGLIHVSSGHRGYETALVGVGAARAPTATGGLRGPVVLEGDLVGGER